MTPEIIEECARLLHKVHSVSGDCPFDQRLETKIRVASSRVDAGLVNEDNFDSERLGKSALEILNEVCVRKPGKEDLVFTHGDFTPSNILFDESKPLGLVDWGKAGLADRYQDLALFCRSLSGSESIRRFLSAYGVETLDEEKLDFYMLLDELF